jgi:hypothetical protein
VAIIARQLGISRPTVYAYLRRTTPPGPKRPQCQWTARVLTPFVPYLIHRWRAGGANSMQLWREIRALGYRHSARTVCRFITQQVLRSAPEPLQGWKRDSPSVTTEGPLECVDAEATSMALPLQHTKGRQAANHRM